MPDYGGITFNNGNGTATIGHSPGDTIGRFFNDISGKSAENEFNASEAQKARDFNSAEALKQRDWEEYMSNTSYQRAVSDMAAAGLNPALAISQGGASSPSGASATSPAAQASSSGNGLMGLISRCASVAIAKGLEAKFTHSAMKAADEHELVTAKIHHLAAEERSMSAQAAARAARDKSRERYERAMAASRVNDSFAENQDPESDYRAALHAYDYF